MITLKHLSKVYRTTEVETAALRDINLEVAMLAFRRARVFSSWASWLARTACSASREAVVASLSFN